MTLQILSCNLEDIRINPKYREAVPGIVGPEREEMRKSIRQNGVLEPITVNEKMVLLDGHQRYDLAYDCLLKSIPYKTRRFDSELEQFHYVIECNYMRRQLTLWQRGKLLHELVKIEKQLARQRQKAGTLASIDAKGKSTEKIARDHKYAQATLERVEKIIKEAPPEVIKKLDEGKKTINSVYNQIRIQENKKLPKLRIPAGKYNLVIWDPSWPHDIEVAGGSGNSGNAQRYRPESIQEMKDKGLQNVLADDAILGIWTLPTFHSEVLEVIQANGFEKIKTKVYWDKMVPTMGFNFRNSVEELCICVRGKVKAFWQTDQPNIIHEKRGGPHSRKPEIFFEIMEKAAESGLPRQKLGKLEINATKPRKGWTTVGNQIKKATKAKSATSEKCKCNHYKIIHNDDHKTGEKNGGFCPFRDTCHCEHFTPKKKRTTA